MRDRTPAPPAPTGSAGDSQEGLTVAIAHGQEGLTARRGRGSGEPDHGRRPLPTREDMLAVAASFPQTVKPWDGAEGPRPYLIVSSGFVQIGAKDRAKEERRLERARARRRRMVDHMVLDIAEPGWTGHVGPPAGGGTRGRITGLSAESRNRMMKRFCGIDYSQIFDGTRTPAMVTLTMPHDWTTPAPSGKAFKEIVNNWRSAYNAAWGEQIPGIWKLEFQYRQDCADGSCSLGPGHDPRAPHLHILTYVQPGAPRFNVVSSTGDVATDFYSWVSYSWAKAVRHPDPEERAKHERAGTRVDIDETLRYGDPKRIAVYFTKHGTFKAKRYQDVMPTTWLDSTDGDPTYWGVWCRDRLPKAEGYVEMTPWISDRLARSMRARSAAEQNIFDREISRSRRLPAAMLEELVETARSLVASDAGYLDVGKVITGLMSDQWPVTTLRVLSDASAHAPTREERAEAAGLLAEIYGSQLFEDALNLLRVTSPDRRWSRVWAHRGGEARLHVQRRARRRVVHMRRSAGFVMVNDGRDYGEYLRRLVVYYDSIQPDGFLDDAAAPSNRSTVSSP